MKKFASCSALAKAVILSAFAALFFVGCQQAKLSPVENANTPAPVASATESVSPDDNINRPRSEPYTGDLSIFEDARRAENLQIDRVMDILKITNDSNVADIGAGGGWFTARAAKRVGANGKVFAVEINQDYIKAINERARRENLSNIQTVLGAEDNPNLPKNSVDAVLILKTYHEIGQPIKVLENLRSSLRKDARVGIIDRNGSGGDHGIQSETVIEELKRAGYSLVDQYDFVKPDGMDYFLVFRLAN